MMTWRVVDVTMLEGSLHYSKGHLVVESQGSEPVKINLREIQMVLVGQKTQISGSLIYKLAALDIPWLLVDWRLVPVAGSMPWYSHTRVGARQISQDALSIPKRKSAWAELIREKIRNQALVLHQSGYFSAAKDLLEIAKSVRSGDPDNREGYAARMYWKHLSLDPDFARDPNSTDPENAALNYGYTLVRGAGIRSVIAAGLWPAIGVFHRGRSNLYNLVDDLMEPFRPAVDLVVSQLSSPIDMKNRETKRIIAAVLQGQFTVAGASLDTSFTNLARSYGRYVEGDERKIVVPRWGLGSFDE